MAGGGSSSDASGNDARMSRAHITANLAVVSLLEAHCEDGEGVGPEVVSYTEARSAIEAAILSTPGLLDELEHDLFNVDDND